MVNDCWWWFFVCCSCAIGELLWALEVVAAEGLYGVGLLLLLRTMTLQLVENIDVLV